MSEKKSAPVKLQNVMVGILIGILFLIGVGFGLNKLGSTTVTTTPDTSDTSDDTASTVAPAAATIGSTINIGGDAGLKVTAQQVIDPATPSNEANAPDPGQRLVGVKVQITNSGTSAYSDDANNNLSLIGNDDQTYTANFSDISGCTNFSYGQYTLGSGDSATGCVIFEVPSTVKPAQLQFTSHSGFSGQTGEWIIN